MAEDPATVVRAGPFLLWRLLHTVALGVGDILYPRLRECWMPVAVLVGMVGSWVWSVACFGLVNWHENFHKSLSVLCFPYWILVHFIRHQTEHMLQCQSTHILCDDVRRHQ